MKTRRRSSPCLVLGKGQDAVLAWWIVFSIVAVIIALAALIPAWRFMVMRPHGNSVIVRVLPAQSGHGWRHGSMLYQGTVVKFYKLRSFSPTADLTIDRQYTRFVGRRDPQPDEVHTLEPGLRILQLKVGERTIELAVDSRGEMAFLAWLESAPTRRLERSNATKALRSMNKAQRRRL